MEKYEKLKKNLRDLGTVAVAFSGGVDSTFLAKVSKEVLGDKAIAITVAAPMHPKREIEEAIELAQRIDINHKVLKVDNLDIDGLRENPINRCYICKTKVFSMIKEIAHNNGFEYVLDGSNIDDLSDYRPGLKAIEELEVKSPLKESGLTKGDIRALSKELDLPTWDKPAFACLITRVPYGEELTEDKLKMIEGAEDILIENGFRQFRVRYHGDTARIEVAPEERVKFFDLNLMDNISKGIKELGFTFVSLDLEGYKMGNMNTGRV